MNTSLYDLEAFQMSAQFHAYNLYDQKVNRNASLMPLTIERKDI